MDKLFSGGSITIYHNKENNTFVIQSPFDYIVMDEDTTKDLTIALSTKILSINDALPFSVGDHVKVLGNSSNTAWESGCIEQITGDMAHILYGVHSLEEFGGIRGMGMPVPLSHLRKIP